VPRRLTDEKRDAVLRGARAAFAELGYHGASIGEIVKRAGVARGTFYSYFDSKRDAFVAVLDDLLVTVWQQVRPISDSHDVEDIRKQIRDNVAAICRVLIGDLGIARILIAQAITVDAELEGKVRNFYHRLLVLVEESLREGQARGIVRDGDVSILATSVIGVVKEVIFQYLLGTRRPTLEQMVEETERLVGYGVYREQLMANPGEGSG